MTRIEESIIIPKPVSEVFQYTSDWEKWSDWFKGVSDFEPTTEIKKGNGAHYVYKANMMGINAKVDTVIHDYITDKGWRGKSTRGMPFQTQWIFQPVDEGTKFTYVLEYSVQFPLLGTLMEKSLLKPQWIKILTGSLQNLKDKFV